MAPARASATTSASSARDPQFENTTGVSAGTVPKRIGNVPPPTPRIETRPPAATAPDPSGPREVARHALTTPGRPSIRDEHYPPRPAGALERKPRAHGAGGAGVPGHR